MEILIYFLFFLISVLPLSALGKDGQNCVRQSLENPDTAEFSSAIAVENKLESAYFMKQALTTDQILGELEPLTPSLRQFVLAKLELKIYFRDSAQSGAELAEPYFCAELSQGLEKDGRKTVEDLQSLYAANAKIAPPIDKANEQLREQKFEKVLTTQPGPFEASDRPYYQTSMKYGNPKYLSLIDLDDYIAFQVYTMAAYKPLNEFLRHEGNGVCGECGAFSAQLISALAKLPDYSGVVYRGISIEKSASFDAEMQTGKTVPFSAFTSTSYTRAFSRQYQLIIFGLNGKLIEDFAVNRGEHEVLFAPGMILRVLARDGDTIVLKQIL